MKVAKALWLLLELTLLVVGFATGGPLGEQVRSIALVVAVVIVGAVLFVAVCLVIALIQHRQPPYKV